MISMNIIPMTKEGYLEMSSEAFKDGNLSFGAKGLLTYALSIQNDKDLSVELNREHFGAASPKDRQFPIKKYIRELEAAGYAHYEISSNGRIKTILKFFDTPLPEHNRSNRTNWRSQP
jgi:hypothetical protein